MSELNELGKTIGFKTSTTDEATINTGLSHNGRHIVGLDAATVQNTSLFTADPLANQAANATSFFSRADFAGADGPNGLIGENN